MYPHAMHARDTLSCVLVHAPAGMTREVDDVCLRAPSIVEVVTAAANGDVARRCEVLWRTSLMQTLQARARSSQAHMRALIPAVIC